jgi:uracil-DNA glycosylase family protein
LPVANLGYKRRMAARITYPGAAGFVPDTTDLDTMRAAAATCEGCDLYAPATQTVFGSGPVTARLMLVGEQPGDVEDQRGEPFVGPAGALLVRALKAADLDEIPRWTTNAVKHFRFTERGKRRLHEKPSAAQSTACRPWLAAEIASLRPTTLLALGATAAGSLFGSGFRLTANRGVLLTWPPEKGDFAGDPTPIDAAFATIHPSAILRTPDDERDAAFEAMVADLRLVRDHLTA